jgi:hypothetical protein
MKIKWLIDTFASVETKLGEVIFLEKDKVFEVPDDEEYFIRALARGWCEKVEEKVEPNNVRRTKVEPKEEIILPAPKE